MASRVIAQMLLQLTAVASRAFVSAYQQALQNAKAGGAGAGGAAAAQAAMKSATGRLKMQSDEALKILNLERTALTKPVLEEQYKKFFAQNDPGKGGSFYLQSKIFRAKEALDLELNPPPHPPPTAAEEESSHSSSSSTSSSSSSGDSSSGGSSRFDRFKK